jgi:anaerobic magnesium-protoporphyrin IX monomethyl ester cyclase
MALAASLEAAGHDVSAVDATTLARPWTDLAERLHLGRYDVIGVTAQAATFHNDAVAAVRLARRQVPGAVILAGGSHASLNAERLFAEAPQLDYLLFGEGERTLLELVDKLGQGPEAGRGLAGVAWRREDGSVAYGPARPLIDDLDSLPMPAYHAFDLENDTYYLHGMGRRTVGISTSRGCGDRCSYCSESQFWTGRWRGRSGPLVVEEMRHLQARYGKSLFVFNENSFNQSRERNEAFLESLGRSGLKCDYWFQSRVKDILRDRDLLKDFKRLGLYEVMLGVESVSPEVLRHYAKKHDAEQVREAAALLRENGIMVMTNVMFGDAGDTEDSLRHMYELVTEIGDFLVLTITTPLPGTPYHARALADGRIEEGDFAKYDFMNPIMRNETLTREAILALQKKYLRRYYTRPSVFWKMLFSTNPFVTMAYRLIMRYAWYEARQKQWYQPNYQPIPAGLAGPEASHV